MKAYEEKLNGYSKEVEAFRKKEVCYGDHRIFTTENGSSEGSSPLVLFQLVKTVDSTKFETAQDC